MPLGSAFWRHHLSFTPEIAPPEKQPPVAEVGSPELDRSLVHGIAWTGASKWIAQAITWASTLTVARILSPSDYGIISMATVYLGLLTVVSEFGVGAAVVTLTDLTSDQLEQINTFAVLVGLTGFAVTCAMAIPMGHFFKSPQLPAVILIMSLGFVINSFQAVPSALLQKALRFRTLSLIDGTKTIILAVVTVIFAMLGFRYWTLVIGSIGSAVIGTLLILRQERRGFAIPHFASLRNALRFSTHILISRISWYGYSNSDFVVAGRMLGQAPLGSYTLAWTLSNIPVEKITGMIGSVTPAFFASIQKDRVALKRYFLQITEGLACLTFPVSLGLAVVAPDFVRVILGPKWIPAIVPLQLLALYVSIRSIAPLIPQVLNVIGRSQFNMYMSMFYLFTLPAGFYYGSRFGAVGIAAAWVILYPVVSIPLFLRVLKDLDIPVLQYVSVLAPSFLLSVMMALGVLLVDHFAGPFLRPISEMVLKIVVGVGIYVGGMATLFRDRTVAIYRRFRSA